MNLSSAEACLHGSVDKWASITRVFYSLIKIYHRPNIFSHRVSPLPSPHSFVPLRGPPNSASSTGALRRARTWQSIQFSKIRISPSPILRGSNTFHSIIFIHRADDFKFYLPLEGRGGELRSVRHINVWKTLSKFTYREYESRYEDNWPGFFADFYRICVYIYRENKVLFCTSRVNISSASLCEKY